MDCDRHDGAVFFDNLAEDFIRVNMIFPAASTCTSWTWPSTFIECIGLLEKVYKNALAHELKLRGFLASTETPITVLYKGEDVGYYQADLLVNQEIIVEIKCVRNIVFGHIKQVKNYL